MACSGEEDAERIFSYPEQIYVKGRNINIKRNYKVGENSLTDAKMYIRVYNPPSIDDITPAVAKQCRATLLRNV